MTCFFLTARNLAFLIKRLYSLFMLIRVFKLGILVARPKEEETDENTYSDEKTLNRCGDI